MASYNQVILIGNLTRDPEVTFAQSGKAVGKIGLAVNRSWRSETGEMKKETAFIDVTLFGKTAETVAKYCTKGNPLFVQGRLKLDTWVDKQTQDKRSKLNVVAEVIQLMSAPKAEQSSPTPGQPTPTLPGLPKPPTLPVEEDDVPF